MTEITREHLELAALAGSVEWNAASGHGWVIKRGVYARWCPHLDDGDAARLAVRLQMDVAFGHHLTHKVYASRSTAFPSCPVSVAHDGTEPDKLRHARDAVAKIRAERVSAADELCPECGMRGWHKLDCSRRDPERVELPATRDAGGVVTVCQRPCRCGPDMCADSVACPRR